MCGRGESIGTKWLQCSNGGNGQKIDRHELTKERWDRLLKYGLLAARTPGLSLFRTRCFRLGPWWRGRPWLNRLRAITSRLSLCRRGRPRLDRYRARSLGRNLSRPRRPWRDLLGIDEKGIVEEPNADGK